MYTNQSTGGHKSIKIGNTQTEAVNIVDEECKSHSEIKDLFPRHGHNPCDA
jgi:hypothetical protein